MNRRGFFGALVGGIAAATGVRRLASLRRAGFGSDLRVLPPGYVFTTWDQLRRDLGMAPGPHFEFKPDFSVRRPEVCDFERPRLSSLGQAPKGCDGDASGIPVVSAGRVDDGFEEVRLDATHDVDQPVHEVGLVARPAEDQCRHERLKACDPAEHAQSEVTVIHGSLPVRVDTLTDLPEVWPGHSGAIAATAGLPPLDQYNALVELFGKSGEASPSFAFALIGELVLTRLRLAGLRRIHAPVHAPVQASEGMPS